MRADDMLLLGIDVGTSSVKAGLFDRRGTPLGFGCSRRYAPDSPRPGWSEVDPALWWAATVEAIRTVCAGIGERADGIAGVGLSVLFPSVVPMDARGAVLYPAILYNDQRSGAQVRRILRRIPREEYQATIGNVLVPGNCAVSGIAWLREEEPGIYRKADLIGFTNTYILSRLTGTFATDTTMASVTGLADIRAPHAWSREICGRLDIDAGKLPEVMGPAQIAGRVKEDASRETGLKAGIPVVCGCGDAMASAFGGGFLSAGTVVYTAGSTDCVVFSMDEPSSDRRWVCCGFEPGKNWGEIGTSTATGASIEWFGRTFLGTQRNGRGGCEEGYRLMNDLAASSEPGGGGVIFLPYLQGERTPVWDPDERGVFIGLTHRTSLGALARAVFEGTSFALRHIIETLENVSPVPVKEIVAVGGGTKNDLWNRIKADVLQMPLHVLEFQETGTLGAALLAGIGAGVFESYGDASEAGRRVNRTRRVDPDPGKKGLYDELFSLYKRIHPRVKSLSHSLTRLDSRKDRPPRSGPVRRSTGDRS